MIGSAIKNHRRMIGATAAIATAGAIAATLIGVPALATSVGGGFSAVQTFAGTFAPLDVKAEKDGKWDLMLKTKGRTDIRVSLVTFPAPSGSSGWHSHPGPNLLTVTEGSVIVYDGDDPACPEAIYGEGDTFYDDGGTGAHLVRNNGSSTAIIRAIAFYPEGATPTRIDRLKPTNCTVAG